MTGQVLFFDVFFEKDPHLNAVERLHPISKIYVHKNFFKLEEKSVLEFLFSNVIGVQAPSLFVLQVFSGEFWEICFSLQISEAVDIGVLQIKYSNKFSKSQRNTTALETLFIKVTGLYSATLYKKKLHHLCSFVNFEKFLISFNFQKQLFADILQNSCS